MVLLSVVPSDKTTLKVEPVSCDKSLPSIVLASTIICVVDTPVFILPPLRTPALTGSCMPIIVEGLTITPASSVVVNETTSASNSCEYKNHRPNLFAWPLEVQAKDFIVFLTKPNLSVISESILTLSKSICCVSLSK